MTISNDSAGAALELGDVKVAPGGGDEGQAAKDEAHLALEVPLIGVDHVGDGEVEDDAADGLGGGGEGNGGGPEGGAARLSQDGKGHGAEADVVEEGVDDGEGGLHPLGAAGVDEVHDADEDEDGGEDAHAEDEDPAAAKRVHDGPAEDVAGQPAGGDADAEVEALLGGEAGELEEVGGEAEDEDDAGEVLAHEDAHADEGADAVGALEALDEGALLGGGGLLLGNGGLEGGELGVDVDAGSVELAEGPARLVALADAGEVPGRLGGKGQQDYEEEAEEELDGKGAAVGPAVGAVAEALDDGVGQQLAGADAELHAGGGDAAEGDGGALGGRQGRQGQVEAEAEAEDELGDDKGAVDGGQHLAEDAAGDDGHAGEEGGLATPAVGDPRAEEAAKELADAADGVEGALPVGGEDVLAVVEVAKVAAEGPDGEHASVDLSVEAPGRVSTEESTRRDSPANSGHGPVKSPPHEGGVLDKDLLDGQLMLTLDVDSHGVVLGVDVVDAGDGLFGTFGQGLPGSG
ncbi:hypothetical protein Trco_002258 [Trichoderma cornu-damae]|uniref:Uncharacterized protein n=1 Tax=Trichoderma cornu-damae TaxID=654480 RepID=A0A9P8QUJ1_9HYPO|nr:hypothetical protein Trco_002258 [Trichoderma cornu-damae]